MEEMRYFLEVVKAYSMIEIEEGNEEHSRNILKENNSFQEKQNEDFKEQVLKEIFLELKELKECWLAYTSTEDNQYIAEGMEKGLFKASDMLEKLIEIKYGWRL